MQHDLLGQGPHFNLPKMHLISHFADQILKYGSVLQYLPNIYKASHIDLNQEYWQVNHSNVLSRGLDVQNSLESFYN